MILEKILPSWFIFLLFFIASSIVIFSYLKNSKNIPSQYLYLLLGLKLTAIAVLFFAFFQPYITLKKYKDEKSTVAILVDTSPSMTFEGADKLSRLNRINNIFQNKNDNFLEKLKKNNTIKIYSFSDQIISVQENQNFSPFGYRTKLINSMENLVQSEREGKINNIILFSDGQDPDLDDFLKKAQDFECQINPVEIDSSEKIKDIHLLEIKKEDIAYLDRETEIGLLIKNSNFHGEETKIILLEEDKEVLNKKILINKDIEEIKLNFKPLSRGWHKYTLIIQLLKDEIVKENNQMIFYQQVIQEKIKVLFIEGTPRLDFKFIKKVLEGDKNLEVDFLVYKNKKEFYKFDKQFLNSFPQDDAFFQYNIVIISDIPYQYFTDKEISEIKNFVEKWGGRLLFIAGENSTGYANTELEKILPVSFPSENIFYDDNFLPVLTREGNIHPITTLDPNGDNNRKIWNDFPLLTGILAISKAKPGAIILAMHPDIKFNSGFLIVMALHEYGRGKTMILNAEGLWRWDFFMWGIGDKNAYAAKYWKNIIHYFGEFENKKNFYIQTDKRLYIVGENIRIRVYLYDKLFNPITNANIECTIKNVEKGTTSPVEIANFENIPGIYGGEFTINEPEEAIISAKATHEGKVIGMDYIAISIVPDINEYRDLEFNSEKLKKLAEVTNGIYLTPDSLKNADEKLKKAANRGFYIEKIELWDTVWYFVVFIFLLIAEWSIRKKKGLD